MDEHDLRRSLQSIGPRLPALIYEGETIDGRKRQRLCTELGLELGSHVCSSLREACSMLWAHHPERAIKLAGAHSVRELAELCGARVAAVARVIQKQRPPRRAAHRLPRHVRGQKNVLLQVWIEPQLRTLARDAAAREGLDLSAFTRQALWERAQIVDARAPAHGSRAAPKWVKPPERKRRR